MADQEVHKQSKKANDKNTALETRSNATNPFFIFLHEFRRNVAERDGGINRLPARDITRMAGENWRQMSNDDKLSYIVWARKNQSQKISSRLGRDNLQNSRKKRQSPLRGTKSRRRPRQSNMKSTVRRRRQSR